MRESQIRFIRQQGVTSPEIDTALYTALMFQPRFVGVVFAVAVAQGAWLFLALSAVLWLGALVPAANAFDLVYNQIAGYPRGLGRLRPRRFAAGLAGTLLAALAAALLSGALVTAWALEAFFAVAVAAVVFGDRCAGADLYHYLATMKGPRDNRRRGGSHAEVSN